MGGGDRQKDQRHGRYGEKDEQAERIGDAALLQEAAEKDPEKQDRQYAQEGVDENKAPDINDGRWLVFHVLQFTGMGPSLGGKSLVAAR